MRTLIYPLLLTTSLSSTAIAGSVTTDVIAPVAITPPTAAIIDWSGFYAGGTVSYLDVNEDVFLESGAFFGSFPTSGVHAGVMAGYNFQRGAMVYGAEVDYSLGQTSSDEFPDDSIEYLFDAKARVGYAFGNALLYAVAGGSFGHYEEVSEVSESELSGFSYGLGIDYKIGNQYFVGLEYLRRELSGDFTEADTRTADIQVDTIFLRAGITF